VARLDYRSGSVSFRPGSVEEWTDATLNFPLTTGDHLWTDPGSQAEMHIGSTGIRLAPQTAMSFLNLDDRTIQLSVTQGSLNIRLRNLADDETVEVDTPNVSITLLRPGDYRIDADGDNDVSTVTVRSGDVAVTGGGAAFPVHARETARIRGVDTVAQEIFGALPQDGFDRWCQDREMRLDRSESARYVGAEMTGYEDLDDHGVWREDPQYGWIWIPRVEIGWAPYRFGHWAWVDPWGWTWVDDAPWGFAPFHYGRWAMVAGGWVWVPGTRVARPVYAPALVAFVGGPGFGVALGVGGGGGVAAWFPLGPHEVYRPAYHVSEVYVRQVNITHVTNINVVNVRYVNQAVPGAVTAVSQDTFVSARPVGRGAIVVNARAMSQAQVVGATAQVAPRRESVLAGTVRVGGARARYTEHTVVAKTPPPPPPVSFRARQRALEANQGKPLEPAEIDRIRGNAPVPHPMVRTVTPQAGGGKPNPAVQRNVEQPAPRTPVFERTAPPVQRNVEQPQVERPPQRPAVVERPAQEERREAVKKDEKKNPKKKEEEKKQDR